MKTVPALTPELSSPHLEILGPITLEDISSARLHPNGFYVKYLTNPETEPVHRYPSKSDAKIICKQLQEAHEKLSTSI